MTISANTPARVAVLLTVIAVALVLLLAGTVAALAGGDTSAVPVPGAVASATVTADGGEQATHLVRSGDTLWDIATAHTEPGDDVRDTLLDIKRANGLSTSMITPGQVLVIPTSG
jgi:nucleoid-associated protein YgaU